MLQMGGSLVPQDGTDPQLQFGAGQSYDSLRMSLCLVSVHMNQREAETENEYDDALVDRAESWMAIA